MRISYTFSIMSKENHVDLGVYDSSLFDTHDAMGEHATKSFSEFREFTLRLGAQGTSLPCDDDEAFGKYLIGRGGAFYRTLASKNGKYALIHAVALERDANTKEATIVGSYEADDEMLQDGIHKLWLRKIIPQLSFTKLGSMAIGRQTKAIRFPKTVARPHMQLLDVFGIEDDASWYIPIPELTIDVPDSKVDEMIERSGLPPKGINVTIATETKSRYFDDGTEIGSMTIQDNGIACVTDNEGVKIPVSEPKFTADPDYDLFSYLKSNPIQRQLGYATLRRNI